MKRLKNITILLCFLSLLAFISCSAEDKTGVANNPPENDTEITSGGTETGGSGTETGGSGTETGGGSGTGTGGDSGSGTGTGGETGGSGSGSGSGEGGGGTETPPSPSEPETIEIDAKDFPTDLLGTYRDEEVASAGYSGVNFDTKVSYDETTTKTTKIEGSWLKDGTTDTYPAGAFIEKWKQTKKGGNPIKLEGEFSDTGGGKYIITYDYASGTLSGTYAHSDGTKASFNGKKI